GFWSSSTKLSASSAFRSSPRSLVPAAASRRRRTPRRIQTPSAPRSQSSSDILEKTLRVLGDLGVWIVSAISRPPEPLRRQRTPRRIHTPSAPRSQRFLVLVDKTLRVLGVSIVSAISRRRSRAEEAEDAEMDSN